MGDSDIFRAARYNEVEAHLSGNLTGYGFKFASAGIERHAPYGKLHLGNSMGALANWVKLEHEYDCYLSVADWHANLRPFLELGCC